MKVSMPQLPFVPAQKPSSAPPQQAGEQDVEQDAELFRQSLSENETPSASKPKSALAEQEQADATQRRPATPGTAQHGHETAGATRHEAETTGVAQHAALHKHGKPATAQHKDGRTGAMRHKSETTSAAQHEAEATGAARDESGAAGAAAQQGGADKAATDNARPHAAQADDSPGLAEADEKDTETIAEPGQDLHQLLATQEARSQEIAVQGTGDVAPAISPELVDKVAERILVSVGNDGQDREVRILVKDSVLQNTEVSLKYEQGDLVVNFITQSAADNVLLNNNSQALKTSLETALDGNVRVNVSAETDDAGNTRDDRRSRGMYIDEEDDGG